MRTAGVAFVAAGFLLVMYAVYTWLRCWENYEVLIATLGRTAKRLAIYGEILILAGLFTLYILPSLVPLLL